MEMEMEMEMSSQSDEWFGSASPCRESAKLNIASSRS